MPLRFNTKIAVVTGSNKGIGFSIVKGLLENEYPGTVYLTYRNDSNGKQAVDALNKLGYYPSHHQLDISNINSIETFATYLKQKHGGIDLLINNAAIKYDSISTVPLHKQVATTLETNYFGTKNLSTVLSNILRSNGQIINVSSAAGHICAIPCTTLRSKFALDITLEQLEHILQEFLLSCENNKIGKDWKNAGYIISKVAVCALTLIQQRQFDNESEQRNIRVNSVHPGYVSTDMTKHKGIQSPDDGAKSSLFLALKYNHDYKGQFIWYDCTLVDWLSDTMPKDIKPC